ncbi:MAG: hydrolase [Paenibacillus sp.]|nr:hydrolase [Paenibacillus sp.]
MNLNETVVTAGVYVNINGQFPFQVGPTKAGTALGVVRLGGHREQGETGWQCASREAFEEASLRITPIRPPATYWYEASGNPELSIGGWQQGDVEPILVGKRVESNQITPIYLAYSKDSLVPSAETKGLLLLSPADVANLVSAPITLGQYLESGGRAVFGDTLPLHLPLEPFPHLRLLDVLIKRHPEIVTIAD